MGITPWEKANQRLGKTASLLKKHAGGWELMGMDGGHADGFCHAGGGGSNGIAAYRTDYGDGSYGRNGNGWEPCGREGWEGKSLTMSHRQAFGMQSICMVPLGRKVQAAEANSFFCIGRCGDE